jgi:NTP pyrophosphatase (non-canonical NTP hydrolase)
MTLKEKLDQLGVRDEVLAFAMEMEHLLRENEHKGGWADSSLEDLLEKLKEEVEELEEAIKQPGYQVEACREAGDVGNIAMMIFDISLGRDPLFRRLHRHLATIPAEARWKAWEGYWAREMR